MYKKIYKTICFLCALGISLFAAIIILVLATSGELSFLSGCLIIIAAALIFLLCQHIGLKLTDGILKPLEKPLNPDSENLYDEIMPLKKAIEYQSAEIKRQAENVQSREIQLQHITENMSEGLIILDSNGFVLSVNNFVKNLFCIDDISTQNIHFSVLCDAPSFKDAVGKALNQSRSNALIELDNAVYRIYCSPLDSESGEDGVIILLFDITNTYQSEKLRREFSANVSHELKTPLTSINGYAQLISNKIAQEEDVPQFAEKIAKECQRLVILIEDIMRLSNLDEGTPEGVKSEVSIKDIVLQTISLLNEKALQRDISLNFSGDDFSFTANRTLIEELIYNLCDNAIKYNKDGGSVFVTIHGNTLSVSDTGIGIPQEYISRIFERFFRVDKSHSKKVDGTGLGLSIVKHIAIQLGIEIDVKSTLNEGTVFTLHFPV